jgi:ribosomal protein L11 methyltransferase
MIKVNTEIPSSTVENLEDYLYEIAPSPWVLIINYLNGSGSLTGYFDCQDEAQCAITEIREFSLTTLRFDFLEIQDRDWKDAYKEHFHPWKYKNFHLIPSWMKEDYPVPTDHLSLFLDPGMAFGTGNHETTRMCLELLIDGLGSTEDNVSLLDLGCGSGLLSLAASLLGYGPQIVGLDNDGDAVRISKENAEINQLADKVSFMVGDLYKLNEDIGQFDYIVANIQADVLKSNVKNIFRLSHSQSTIILSGILAYEIEDVIETFNKHAPKKFLEPSVKEMGEWASVKFSRLG